MQPQRLPDSLPAGIDVFQLALDLEAPLSDADWALLSEEEGVRALRFLRHGDKVRFVVTRAALRRLLGARLRRRPQTLRFVTNSYGKPRLEAACSSNPAIFFNVSHAGSFALIALSERAPVGVDIERAIHLAMWMVCPCRRCRLLSGSYPTIDVSISSSAGPPRRLC